MEQNVTGPRTAHSILFLNVIAFTVCFAAWMINGVLVTFLIDKGIYAWNREQMGWLIGIPVLTGAIMRLPMGMLTEKFGGRIVFSMVMLLSAVPMFLLGYANTYTEFLLASLGFGLAGSTFAIGVGYVSLWFPKEKQGTALGIFGFGNIGVALTSMGAPLMLQRLTDSGTHLEGWRTFPKLYAASLMIMAIVFFLFTSTKIAEQRQGATLAHRLAPLRNIRVWRFGLYYFFVFGGFVAVSQWLIPYYVNVYGKTVAAAGMIAAAFSLPSCIFRAVGGWAADRCGARTVMYSILSTSIVTLIFLLPPRMELQAPGQGVLADRDGKVTLVTDREIVIGENRYVLSESEALTDNGVKIRLGIHATSDEEGFFVMPVASFHQEALVKVGDEVAKRQLIARGVTQIYFQANVWIFTTFILVLGIAMGVGSGAVFKHIPSYFPANVGVVGGLVGVLGGLGGFFGPIIFGYLLSATGIWTTCWMFLGLVALICLLWMHLVVRRMMRREGPILFRQMDETVAT